MHSSLLRRERPDVRVDRAELVAAFRAALRLVSLPGVRLEGLFVPRATPTTPYHRGIDADVVLLNTAHDPDGDGLGPSVAAVHELAHFGRSFAKFGKPTPPRPKPAFCAAATASSSSTTLPPDAGEHLEADLFGVSYVDVWDPRVAALLRAWCGDAFLDLSAAALQPPSRRRTTTKVAKAVTFEGNDASGECAAEESYDAALAVPP